MRKRWAKLAVFCLIPCIAAGCWDSREIEEMDINTTVIVDKTDTGYSFTIEIASYTNVQSEQGGTPQSKVLKGEGATFDEARDELERRSDRIVNLSEVQCVVFTERMAYSGIAGYMYRFRENPDYRKTVYAVVSPETPDALMGAASESNTLVGESINDTLESLIYDKQLYAVSMGNILTNLECEYKGYLIPGIALRDNEITFIGYYAMDGNACKGFIPVNEAFGIVQFHRNTPEFHYDIKYKDRPVALNIVLKKKRTNVSYAGGQVHIGIHFDCTASVAYTDGTMEVADDDRKKIGEVLEDSLTSRIMHTVDTSKRLQCDYLDMHEEFRIRYPDIYIGMDWEKEYPNADISVTVSVRMKEGNIDHRPKNERE